MKISKRATALAAVTALLVMSNAGHAASPTQVDFDLCNKEAQARATSPAASPGTTDTARGPVTSPTTPSAPPPAASAGERRDEIQAPRSPSGATSSTPSAGGPGGGTTSMPQSGSPSGGTTTMPPRGTGSDSQLTGMAAAGQSDPAYQQAYRECLKRRGF